MSAEGSFFLVGGKNVREWYVGKGRWRVFALKKKRDVAVSLTYLGRTVSRLSTAIYMVPPVFSTIMYVVDLIQKFAIDTVYT